MDEHSIDKAPDAAADWPDQIYSLLKTHNITQVALVPDAVKQRLVALAGRRMTQDGVLIITAERHRMREANREEARQKLVLLLRKAALPPPPPRKATKPTAGSKARRLESKTRRGAVKRLRGGASED